MTNLTLQQLSDEIGKDLAFLNRKHDRDAVFLKDTMATVADHSGQLTIINSKDIDQDKRLTKIDTDQTAQNAAINMNRSDIEGLRGVGRCTIPGTQNESNNRPWFTYELAKYWMDVKGSHIVPEGAAIVNIDQDAPAGHVWTLLDDSTVYSDDPAWIVPEGFGFLGVHTDTIPPFPATEVDPELQVNRWYYFDNDPQHNYYQVWDGTTWQTSMIPRVIDDQGVIQSGFPEKGRFIDRGVDTVNAATNTAFGVVQGNDQFDGAVQVDLTGIMRVNGWDKVTSTYNGMPNKQDKVTFDSTFVALGADVNGKLIGKPLSEFVVKPDPLNPPADPDIIDALNSTKTDRSLSANQGRILNEKKLDLAGGILTGAVFHQNIMTDDNPSKINPMLQIVYNGTALPNRTNDPIPDIMADHRIRAFNWATVTSGGAAKFSNISNFTNPTPQDMLYAVGNKRGITSWYVDGGCMNLPKDAYGLGFAAGRMCALVQFDMNPNTTDKTPNPMLMQMCWGVTDQTRNCILFRKQIDASTWTPWDVMAMLGNIKKYAVDATHDCMLYENAARTQLVSPKAGVVVNNTSNAESVCLQTYIYIDQIAKRVYLETNGNMALTQRVGGTLGYAVFAIVFNRNYGAITKTMAGRRNLVNSIDADFVPKKTVANIGTLEIGSVCTPGVRAFVSATSNGTTALSNIYAALIEMWVSDAGWRSINYSVGDRYTYFGTLNIPIDTGSGGIIHMGYSNVIA